MYILSYYVPIYLNYIYFNKKEYKTYRIRQFPSTGTIERGETD